SALALRTRHHPRSTVFPYTTLFRSFLPIILIFAAMYFLMIRPQQNRVKKEKQFESSLKVGDKIVTKAGIHGRISEIADTTMIVRSEEHTSELQSRANLVCRLLLEKK